MAEMELIKETGDVELLSFRISEQEYSLDIMSVREIRSWTKATPLPHSPSYVRGVINLRGTVLPIIDLSARLGLEKSEQSERDVIIVVHMFDQTVGLLVDAVIDILAVPHNEMQQPPEIGTDTGPAFVNALTLVEGRMIRLLDLASIMPRTEGKAA
ncbi:chemotaxis protein CheW [Parasulfitobacter algicola]|uniref:Chemotaxis protein CheW n=1 Tax=Parasulfitobacter algicola TaxID=2614809 RepID=A0ABX2IRG6_9RHOB|nr:chemotaxis protein CheW [Sulfitobacter algicola]NSX55484.1 chemotaxis protein CheW [Sulfitobacter algicola]